MWEVEQESKNTQDIKELFRRMEIISTKHNKVIDVLSYLSEIVALDNRPAKRRKIFGIF